MFKKLQQSDKGDPFNEATAHYRNLQYVLDDPVQMGTELHEIVRFCQLAIQKQKFHGDAHVLLANAFFLAATPFDEGYKYCFPRSVAVIYEWKTNKRMYTRNREIGEHVYQGIMERLKTPLPDWLADKVLIGNPDEMHKDYYSDAINPTSLSRFREIQESALNQ